MTSKPVSASDIIAGPTSIPQSPTPSPTLPAFPSRAEPNISDPQEIQTEHGNLPIRTPHLVSVSPMLPIHLRSSVAASAFSTCQPPNGSSAAALLASHKQHPSPIL